MKKKNDSLVSASAPLLRFLSRVSLKMQRDRWLRLLFHGLGLSSLGASLFLESSVFTGLIRNGYFFGVEQNFVALSSEVVLTGVGIAYFVYLFLRFIFSFR